ARRPPGARSERARERESAVRPKDDFEFGDLAAASGDAREEDAPPPPPSKGDAKGAPAGPQPPPLRLLEDDFAVPSGPRAPAASPGGDEGGEGAEAEEKDKARRKPAIGRIPLAADPFKAPKPKLVTGDSARLKADETMDEPARADSARLAGAGAGESG